MTPPNIFHIVINPPGSIAPELVNHVSEVLGKDPFGVRMLLSGKLPKIAANFDSEEKAKSIAVSLSTCGVTAFTVNDQDLQQSNRPVTKIVANSLKISNGQLIFISRSGAETVVEQGELFLILHGRMRIPTSFKETRTSVKFNLPATIITGGIPVWRKSEETVETTSSQIESFVKLYGHHSLEPLIEIFESSFDFSFLGNKIFPSTIKNFGLTVKELKQVFAGSFFDNRLAEYTPVMQDVEIKTVCRLIYLSFRTRSDV